MKLNTSILFLTFVLFVKLINAQSKVDNSSTNRAFAEKNKEFLNWHNADNKSDDKAGVSTEKAYKLLQGKKSKTVVVAVIDAGVDIEHEDLQGKIWTNTKEIAGNGIDDDYNGYIDDVHGWNYLGNPNGENLNGETAEVTRLLSKKMAQLEGKSEKELKKMAQENPVEFQAFATIYKRYEKKSKNVMNNYKRYIEFIDRINYSETVIEEEMKTKDYNKKDLKNLQKSPNAKVATAAKMLFGLQKEKFSKEELVAYVKHLSSEYEFHYNVKFEGRRNIIGDDPENWSDSIYGNSNVSGPDPKHGTFVSGIIAAVRNNGIGIEGIANDVKIMSLRAVPDGDERDKDIARAIRYAVNNGAQIINMSFGKDFSPQSTWVFEAIDYAADHNVLMVHAAGNDAQNIDTVLNFPEVRYMKNSKAVDSWISVGASTMDDNKNLPADFSNFGKNFVDIFAPGHKIFSLIPGSLYDVESGTSFAAPVVAGMAALLMSYYPEFSAKQIKEIIVKSGTNYIDKKVWAPFDPEESTGKKVKTRFGELCASGSIANLYNAVQMAESLKKK